MAFDYSKVVYVGDCNWANIRAVGRDPANELPTQRDLWQGRADQITSFKEQYQLYAAYTTAYGQGGYIVDRDFNDDKGPLAEAELSIALPPDFQRVLISGGWSLKTSSASATVTGDNLIPPSMLPAGVSAPSSIVCTHTITAYCPESQYSYFASSKPAGNRYASYAGSQTPFVMRSIISCNIGGATITFSGQTASAPIVAALTMPLSDVLVSTGAEQIQGTPWYRCKDVIARQYQGDAS